MPFVAKFPSIGAIQNFDQTDVPTYSPEVAAIDWDGRRLFIISQSNKLVQVDSLDTPWGELVAGTAFPTGAFDWGAKFGPDGFLYGAGAAGANDARINKFNPSAPGTVVSFFGDVGAGFQFSTDANHWAVPLDLDILVGPDSHTYSVSTAFNPSQTGNEVAIIDLTTMSWTGVNFATDTPGGRVTRGITSGGVANAFIVSCASASFDAGFYRVTIAPFGVCTMTKVATIPATDFGPGWTHVDQVTGLLLDETDGNVLCWIIENSLPVWGSGNTYAIGNLVSSGGHDYQGRTTGNVGNNPASSPINWLDLGPSGPVETRLVKISTGAGAIMWSVVCPSPFTGTALINSNRVRFGLYCVLENTVSFGIHMHQIRTLTGTDTPVALNTIASLTQFFSDTTGDLITSCNSYVLLGTPVQHGSTPSPFTGFGLLGSVTPPFQPPGGLTVERHRSNAIHYHRLRG